jgi:hypothetical protein
LPAANELINLTVRLLKIGIQGIGYSENMGRKLLAVMREAQVFAGNKQVKE